MRKLIYKQIAVITFLFLASYGMWFFWNWFFPLPQIATIRLVDPVSGYRSLAQVHEFLDGPGISFVDTKGRHQTINPKTGKLETKYRYW